MAWVPSSLSALRNCGIRSGHCSRSDSDSTIPSSVTAPLLLSVFSSAARTLSSPSVHQHCSAGSLSVCGCFSCSLTYHFASGHAYRMSHSATHMKTSLVPLHQSTWEGEKMDICTGSQQSGRKSGCYRSISFFLTRRRWKDVKKRPGATFFVFYTCTKLRTKSTWT